MKLIYVGLSFMVIFFVDMWPLLLHKKRRELVVSSIVLLLGLVPSILYVFRIEYPSPLMIIDDFLTNVLHLTY